MTARGTTGEDRDRTGRGLPRFQRSVMRPALALVLVLFPALAHALSCMHPNPARDFNAVLDDGKSPVLLIGNLTVVTPAPARQAQEIVTGQYHFRGARLGRDGTEALSQTIAISGRCMATWCAKPPEAMKDRLMVVEAAGEGLTQLVGPCDRGSFDRPDAAGIRALQGCIADGRCSDAAIDAFIPDYRK